MLTPTFLDELLTPVSLDERLACLRAAGLLNHEDVAALLEAAEHLAGDHPDRSHQLAQLAGQAAALLAPQLAPRAAYLQAQAYAIKGEFDIAEELIATARAGYEELGLTTAALRTTVGLMRVLGETGRYPEALAAAQQALAAIGAASDGLPAEAPEYRAVAAMLFQNCGGCYEQIGRYDEALQALAAAERRYAGLGMAEERAQVVENRGLVLMALGQAQAALTAFEGALALYDQEDRDLFRAQALVNMGEARLLLGEYLPSLQAFQAAERTFSAVGATVDRFILLRQMGDAYLAINLHAEAEDAYRQARDGLADASVALHHALTLWGLGATLSTRGRLSEAAQVMAEAEQQMRSLDNLPLLSAILLEESRLAELVGDRTAAGLLARRALDLVAASNWQVQKVYAYLRNAELALPNTAVVERFLTQAQQLVDLLQLPHLRYRLEQRWGHLHLLRGDVVAAESHLEKAIDEIERLRNTLVHERLRASFLQDKTTAYQDLVRLYLDRKDAASIRRAFLVAEQAKSRALVDLIAGAVGAGLGESSDEAVAGQLRQLQRDLNALYNAMLGGSDDGALRPVDTATLAARARDLEHAISHLRLRQAVAGVKSTSVAGSDAPVHPDALLAIDDPLIVYHILGDEILAFVQVSGRTHVARQLTNVGDLQQLLQRLAAQWSRMTLDSTLAGLHGERLQQSTERLLQRLYDQLLAPLMPLLEQGMQGADHPPLVIVPHGLLHQLPFHALFDGAQYMVERFAISYAPSATVYAVGAQPLRSGPALVLAAPDSRIPAVEHEAEAVTAHLRNRSLVVQTLLGPAATRQAVQTAAGDCSILHLACHGLFRGDNPLFSALKLADGWLTGVDVTELDLHGVLVSLSACESGRSQSVSGDEVLGLIYAFLSAGAAALVVSQWIVRDDVTATLMAHWYRHLGETDDLAEALRLAQLDILTHYRHPFFWAPFFLIGQRLAH